MNIFSPKKNGNYFLTFHLDLFDLSLKSSLFQFLTFALRKGNRPTYVVKDPVTKYHCTKFNVCSFNSFRENWQSAFSLSLTFSTPKIFTLGGGHHLMCSKAPCYYIESCCFTRSSKTEKRECYIKA